MWQELFANLDTSTDRLTSASRKSMLKKLTAHTSIDFTASNAYAVVIWAIKNANAYFDRQLLEVYKDITSKETVQNYASNKRVVLDDWRYIKEEHSHYTLDYRLVLNRFHCFNPSNYGNYDYPNGLSKMAHDLLGDLSTVAENLGFHVVDKSMGFLWEPGSLERFHLADGSLFMDVRAFKKGTIHIRLNQEFMRKFNVEAGRLNGWLRSPAEAVRETGIEDAATYFGGNFKLTSLPMLPPGTRTASLPTIPGIAPAVDLDADEAAFFASIAA